MKKLVVQMTEVRTAEITVSNKLFEALVHGREAARQKAIIRVLDLYPAKLGDPEWTSTTIEDEEGMEIHSI